MFIVTSPLHGDNPAAFLDWEDAIATYKRLQNALANPEDVKIFRAVETSVECLEHEAKYGWD